MQRIDEATLRSAGIRPTRQRLTIGRLIEDGGSRHLTPDSLHQEALTQGMRLSLATVYNTLNEFAAAGLVKRVPMGERSWFCTNVSEHHHFYHEHTGRIEDIDGVQPEVLNLPNAPAGMEIAGIDVIVRLRRAS